MFGNLVNTLLFRCDGIRVRFLNSYKLSMKVGFQNVGINVHTSCMENTEQSPVVDKCSTVVDKYSTMGGPEVSKI